MHLHLRYDPSSSHPVAAAFVRGHAVREWLRELERWAIPFDTLECYVLPQSIHDNAPMGLFVVFRNHNGASMPVLQSPYICIGGKLYIPAGARLSPEASIDEIRELFPWEIQVWHPVAGLSGFGTDDKINPATLLSYPEPTESDWSYAHPGLPAKPGMQSIRITPADVKELMEAIAEEIGQKPLDDIPRGEDRNGLRKMWDEILYHFLKGLLKTGQLLNGILPAGNSNRESLFSKLMGKVFGRLSSWMERNLEELQRRRDSEIERLLGLFNEDPDEALQYAIPLNSIYEDRGQALPSDRLGRRSTNFNLNRLGGGTAADSWDIGDHYQTLRERYLRAAQKEIERKDFRKAAYVYAHLLSDYHGAANVLEQGGMYREAAAVYKDHLNNKNSAAECLERGKLYQEAIVLYEELGNDEKTGDLYKLSGNDEKAIAAYDKLIAARLRQYNHLDAARVAQDKLQDPERAELLLLEGWKGAYQPEQCLKKYITTVQSKEEGSTARTVRTIYAKHTPGNKRLAFLNVLEHLHKKQEDEELMRTSLDIAYEIANQHLEQNDTSALPYLKRFLPGDRLIGEDTSRYTSRAVKPGNSERLRSFTLDETIHWQSVSWHRNQLLAIGMKEEQVHMARTNWHGNQEYYSWPGAGKESAGFTWITAPYHSSQVFLQAAGALQLEKKVLSKNKYFSETLLVNSPSPLPKSGNCFVINPNMTISETAMMSGGVMINHYNMQCDLLRTEQCVIDSDGVGFRDRSPLLTDGKSYFSYDSSLLYMIRPGDTLESYDFRTGIRLIAAPSSPGAFFMVVSTNRGCYLVSTDKNKLQVQGNVFAVDHTPAHITILSERLFVMAESKTVTVFSIAGDSMPEEGQRYKVESNIIGIVPTNNRNEIGVVEQGGKVTVLELA